MNMCTHLPQPEPYWRDRHVAINVVGAYYGPTHLKVSLYLLFAWWSITSLDSSIDIDSIWSCWQQKSSPGKFQRRTEVFQGWNVATAHRTIHSYETLRCHPSQYTIDAESDRMIPSESFVYQIVLSAPSKDRSKRFVTREVGDQLRSPNVKAI